MNPYDAPPAGRTDAAHPGTPPGPAGRLMHAFLRVPLFWKLTLGNAVLVALAGAVVTWLVHGFQIPAVPLVAAVTVATLAVALLVNAAVVRVALRPVDTLTRTADLVRKADWEARAPASRVADRQLDRLRTVFNEMLDAVAQSRRRQQDLARLVLEAEERERERIAHELYSGTAQTLAGVLVRLRIIERQNRGEPLCAGVEEVVSEVRDALEEIRAIARRLRPPELDELGVRAALEAHARRLTEGGPIRVDFTGEVPEASLSEGARLALFRIVQEGLTNAVQHARASIVDVRFQAARDGLVAEVSDDGCGFDSQAPLPRPGSGFGLTGMLERAGYVGGTLTIDSAPDRGTRVRLVLPWGHAGDTPRGEMTESASLDSMVSAATPM